MTISTYAPGNIDIIVREPKAGITHRVTGFTDGGSVDFSREMDSFKMYTSVDNMHTRVFSENTSGTAVIHLAQTSDSNDVLQALYDNDVNSIRTGDGIGRPVEVLIKDNSGRSIMFSSYGYIGKPADSSYTADVTSRDWTIFMPNCEQYVGGNMQFSVAVQDALERLGITFDEKWIQG